MSPLTRRGTLAGLLALPLALTATRTRAATHAVTIEGGVGVDAEAGARGDRLLIALQGLCVRLHDLR